jgi:HD-like signal output (HDOD) protein
MVNTQLIEKINALPPLPKTVKDIERAYKDSNVNAKMVAEILEQDPMVIADLLKLLNSPSFGLKREVNDLEQAVSLIGMKSVKDLVINLSVRNLLRTDLSPYGISSEKFAKVSQFQSFLAQSLMKSVNPKKVDKIRLQALLQEIGKVVIADELLLEGEDATFRAELQAGWDIREIEKSYMDVTTAEVSFAMLSYWQFDQAFVNGIKWADIPSQADEEFKDEALILRIASEAVNVIEPLSEKSKTKSLEFVQKLGLSEELFESIFKELTERWSK